MILTRRRVVLASALAASALAAPALSAQALAQADDGPFKLPPLPYAPNALEPHIDATTMQIHHGRHHQAYVTNANAAAKQHPALATTPPAQILSRLGDVPDAVRTAVRNNLGGHANHTMFWEIMGPESGTPDADLAAAVARDLGGLDKLKTDFNAAGLRVFGSGWVFVTVTPAGGLAIETRPNQDTPLMDGKRVLMGNDVWEHAYYLKHQNRRADYLAAWWNVVSWPAVSRRYAMAKAGTLTL